MASPFSLGTSRSGLRQEDKRFVTMSMRRALKLLGMIIVMLSGQCLAQLPGVAPPPGFLPQRLPVYPYLNSEYPTTLISKALWSAQGNRLYVASFDGFVYCYQIAGEQGEARVTPTRVLRWPISTTLGRVYDLCEDPATGMIAIAGSAVIARGYIALFDPNTGLYARQPIILPNRNDASALRFLRYFGNDLIVVNEFGGIWNATTAERIGFADGGEKPIQARQENATVEVFSLQRSLTSLVLVFATQDASYVRELSRNAAGVLSLGPVTKVSGYARAVLPDGDQHVLLPVVQLKAAEEGAVVEQIPERVDRANLTNQVVERAVTEYSLWSPQPLFQHDSPTIVGQFYDPSSKVGNQNSLLVSVGKQSFSEGRFENDVLFKVTLPVRYNFEPLSTFVSPDGKYACLTHQSRFAVVRLANENTELKPVWKSGGLSKKWTVSTRPGSKTFFLTTESASEALELDFEDGGVLWSNTPSDKETLPFLERTDTRIPSLEILDSAQQTGSSNSSGKTSNANNASNSYFRMLTNAGEILIVARSSGDLLLFIADAKSNACTWIATLSGLRDVARSIAFNAESKLLAAVSDEGRLGVWSLSDILKFAGNNPIRARWGAEFEIRDDSLWVKQVDLNSRLSVAGWKANDRLSGILPQRSSGKGWERSPAAQKMLLDGATAVDRFQFTSFRETDRTEGPELATVGPYWLPRVMLIFHEDDLEWGAWTSSGDCLASMQSGNQLFGWQFFQSGKDPVTQESNHRIGQPDFRTGKELYDRFLNPELLNAVMANPGNVSLQKPRLNLATVQESAPSIQITSPLPGAKVPNRDKFMLTARIKLAPSKAIDDFRIIGDENRKPLGPPRIEKGANGEYIASWDVVGIDEQSILRVAVLPKGTEILYSEDSIRVFADAPVRDIRPHLYLMTLSVKEYSLDAWKATSLEYRPVSSLTFPNKDADDISTGLFHPKSLVFDHAAAPGTDLWQLKDGQVTKSQVQKAFQKVQEEFRKTPPAPNDTFVFFVASHGIAGRSESSELDFHIVPAAPDNAKPLESLGLVEKYRESMIPWQFIADLIQNIPCRVVVILDACHSGKAGYFSAAKEAERNNYFLLSACAWNETAQETDGNGVLTKLLLLTVDPTLGADTNGDKFVSLEEMTQFVRDKNRPRVRDLLRSQNPQFKSAGSGAQSVQILSLH